MTEKTENEVNAAETEIAKAPNEAAEEGQTQAQNYETLLRARDAQIAELEAELQAAKKAESEAMIRAQAELANVRKRVEQDVDKARKFALEKFSTALLDVVDNLERALGTLDKKNETHKPVIEGIELTLKSFLDTLKKFGIEVVESTGKMLNPEHHQAVAVIPSDQHESNQVIETMQKGYTLNGRLIRPAMVTVAQ